MHNKNSIKLHTIKEVSILSGLSESTLRYYEEIGLINKIDRDLSSKHRVYTEQDVDSIVAISCLNATGMSIEDIRTYLFNISLDSNSAKEQIVLLQNHERVLKDETAKLKLRREYVAIKIEYWNAVIEKDKEKIEKIAGKAKLIAGKLKGLKSV